MDDIKGTFSDRFSDPNYTQEPPKEEIRELNPEELIQAQFQEFLRETKDRFDKYFSELGYVCFIFHKEKHRGQSVFITNSEKDVAAIVEPYANAPNIVKSKMNKKRLKHMRRVK